MAAIATGQIEADETYAEMMSFCLGCRACEAACPSLVPFGQMITGAREQLGRSQSSPAGRLRRLLVGRVLNMKWLLALVTSGIGILQRLRLFSLLPKRLRLARGLRRQRVFPHSVLGVHDNAPAEPVGSVALLAGCVMDEWFPEVHDATRSVLQIAGFQVHSPEQQQCCGALAAHEGAGDAARRMAEHNTAVFAGFDYIVADAAGCSAHLKEYKEWAPEGESVASRTRDVTEFVADLISTGQLPTVERDHGEVAIQDPCHLRHAQRIITAPREIVRAAGYEPVEIDPDGLCCGAAGLYMVYQHDAAEQLGQKKAVQIRATGLETVVSANPGCEIQLRAHLGKEYRIVHPIELYWDSLNR
jgi:glycolate oxidase iron-sulfur subunit